LCWIWAPVRASWRWTIIRSPPGLSQSIPRRKCCAWPAVTLRRPERTSSLSKGSSNDLGPQFGRLRLVTIGRAFHWMDRPRTLEALDALIEPGGAVALFQEAYPVVPANDWYPSFQAILGYYGAEDPARVRTHHNENHETVLLDSAFSHLERIAVLEPRQTSVEHLVDRALSFGSTWQGRPGSRLKDMALEIRGALVPYARDGLVQEVLEGIALIARRLGEAG